MSIITSKHLEKKINEYHLIPLEVNYLEISNQIFLNFVEIDDFLKFASSAVSENVYYYYSYYNSKEYIIPIDWYSEYSKEFKDEVHQHYLHIELLDFFSPKSLTLFILQSGTLVGIKLDNPWIEKQGVCDAERTIEIIEKRFFREVEEINALNRDQQVNDENELRNIIFNDPEFRFCKNQELRYWYLIELLKKEDMLKYEYLVQPCGIPHNGK